MAVLKPSSWMTLYHKIEAFFNKDPQVHIVYDEVGDVLCVHVDDLPKARALSALLPARISIGKDIDIDVNVLYHSTAVEPMTDKPLRSLYSLALQNNGNLDYIKVVKDILPDDLIYIVFVDEVAYYASDSITDIGGYHATLYQELAKDIFLQRDGISFCTYCFEPHHEEWP